MSLNEKALQLHEQWNGKINTTPKCQVRSREDLAIAYTPGVAEPCKIIAENKDNSNNQLNTLAIGKTFKFLDSKGNLYECTMKKIGNVNNKKATL